MTEQPKQRRSRVAPFVEGTRSDDEILQLFLPEWSARGDVEERPGREARCSGEDGDETQLIQAISRSKTLRLELRQEED